MKKVLKILFLFYLLVVFSNTTFSSEENIKKIKTIKELKKEVQIIKKQKEESVKKLDELKKDLLVKKFFKLNLTKKDQEKLNLIIKNYKTSKKKLENLIIEKSKKLEDIKKYKKEILINEKNFYRQLLEYIDINKYNEYLAYIKENIAILNKSLNLDDSQIKRETIIRKKVDNLKEKVKELKEEKENKTIEIINKKISSILDRLIQKEAFKKLEKNKKNAFFDKLINAIDKKIKKLKENKNKNEIQKIIIENKNKIIENIKNYKNNLLSKEL